MLAKLLLWVCLPRLTLFESRYTLKGRYNIGHVGQTASMSMLTPVLSLNQDIHWREGTTLVMLAKLLLWVCLLSLNQDIHWREGTTLVMLAKLLLWVCFNTLFESRYTLKGSYNIGNVGKTASIMSGLTLFEARYTLKGRYGIGNVGKTASMSMLTPVLSLNQDIHWREGTTLVMLAKLLLWVCLLSLNQDIHWREGTTLVMLAKLLLWVCFNTLFESRYTLKGSYNIGNVGKTASIMSGLTLFEARYTLKRRYGIGNVGKTASMSMLTL